MCCRRRTTSVSWASTVRGGSWFFSRGVGSQNAHPEQLQALSLNKGIRASVINVVAAGPPVIAHVYLLRGLMNIFSLGMDTLAEKIQRHDIYATIHNYAEWQTLADHAAAAYHAGKEGPIIIVGHSLGADAVMEMSAYLGRKGVPVALAVPFDARGSYATPSNVGRLLNLTMRAMAICRVGRASTVRYPTWT
jgi:hypothetical protein